MEDNDRELIVAPTSTNTSPADTEVAQAFLRAVVSRDERRLRGLLADDVWVRAMLVREVVEGHGVDVAVELFHGWFGAAAEIQVLLATTSPVATREVVTYRLRLRPAWAPEVWHLIEQTGYLRVRDGRIRRIDLVCTGFVPEPELPPERVATSAASLRGTGGELRDAAARSRVGSTAGSRGEVSDDTG